MGGAETSGLPRPRRVVGVLALAGATAAVVFLASVPLTASGPGAQNLTGNYENTHVYDVMADTLGIPRAQRADSTP